MTLISIIEALSTSRQINATILAVLMIGFTLSNLSLIESHDTYPDYTMVVEPYLKTCDLAKLPHLDYTDPDTGNHYSETARNPAKWYLNCLGYKVFGGYDNVLPFLFSLGIIGMTYLVAYSISQKRIVGILSSIFVCINPLFYNWASSVTYDQVWAFFLLTSVWLVYRKPILSIPLYLASITTKILACAYLPIYLYTVLKSKHSLEAKLGICLVISLIAISGVAIEYSTISLGAKVSFHPDNLTEGLTRTFSIIVWNLPVLFAFVGMEFMFQKHSQKIPGREICFSWLIGIVLVSVLIYVVSGQFSFPYRFVPFAVFMSIYIGLVSTRVIYCFEAIARKRLEHKQTA